MLGPTSVVANWQDECARFAPELRVVTLGPSERAQTLEGLSRGDLLILSYGLLVREQEALALLQFGTIVFDEAHALKSATSQRAKAAFRLDAKARVTLTGTPVENHLGELWSVMQATVPGMLGSKRQFDDRLGRPCSSTTPERSTGSAPSSTRSCFGVGGPRCSRSSPRDPWCI